MKEQIEQLVREELVRANAKFPPFNSNHEAFAVLLEEIQELQETVSHLPHWKDMLWNMVRGIPNRCSFDQKTILLNMCEDARDAAAEAIQVAAMCNKWIQLLERAKNGRG